MIGNYRRGLVLYDETHAGTPVVSSFDGGISVSSPPNPLTLPDFDITKSATHTLHVGDTTNASIEPDFWVKDGSSYYRIISKKFQSDNTIHKVHVWNIRYEEQI